MPPTSLSHYSMRWSLPFLLSLLPLGSRGLAGTHPKLRPRQCKQQPPLKSLTTNAVIKQGYTLQQMYKGYDFFSDDPLKGWTFYTMDDPTGGNVNFVSKAVAEEKNLTYVRKDGVVVLAVDSTTQLKVGNNMKRDSIRITSNRAIDKGLVIADIARMPYGCSVWPAYWALGPDWPLGGEIDMLEGVNKQTRNQVTFHTTSNCSISQASRNSARSTILSTNCESDDYNNGGCGFLSNDPQSFGEGFNNGGGGVIAHVLNETGIYLWQFSRSCIPPDITAQTPNPSNWGTPDAHLPSTDCDISSHFSGLRIVFDITLCGGWAGQVYGDSGCPGTCLGIVAKAENYRNVQWEINSVAVYYELST